MRRIGGYAASLRVRIAVVLGLAACLAAVMVATQVRPAEANHTDPCKDTQITQIVTGITGQAPQGFACYHTTYDPNLKVSDSYATKQSKITPFINACGTSTTSRYIAQAVVEETGNKPVSASPSGVCSQTLYETHIRNIFQNGYKTVDWNRYRGSTHSTEGAYEAVRLTLGKCNSRDITMAIMELTGQLPKRGGELEDPGYLGSKYFSANGQCESTLYDHGNASYGGYEAVKKHVKARAQSTKTCSDPLITDAYRRMTGWNPLPDSSNDIREWNECSIYRYNNGQWSSWDEIKNYVYHSWRCEHSWIGQIYAKDFGRKALGYSTAGECSWNLYGDYAAGSYDPGTYQEVRSRVSGTTNALTNEGWSFRGGSGDLIGPNNLFVPGEQVMIQSPDGIIASGAANVIANGAGNFVSKTKLIGDHGSGVIVTPSHGSIIASGAANIIATGAANAVPKGGANIQSSYGGG